MAKLKFQGLEEYITELKKVEAVTSDVIGSAVYDGAAVVADAVKEAINNLPIDERRVPEGEMLRGITQQQKNGLRDGFGISAMKDDNGYLNVKLGFDGYNATRTKNFPNGQPNSMIARSLNSGSSFRQRIPFVDDAVRQNKVECEQKMKETFDKELGKAIN